MDVSLAVVGATGAVGELMRQVLAERGFRPKSIRFLASAKSAGKTVTFNGKSYPVEPLHQTFRIEAGHRALDHMAEQTYVSIGQPWLEAV